MTNLKQTCTLKPKDLYKEIDISRINPRSTRKAAALWQQKSLGNALDVALKVERQHAAFVVDGGSSFSRSLEDTVKTLVSSPRYRDYQDGPTDIISVYNFNDPNTPELIEMPAGTAEGFKYDLELILTDLNDHFKSLSFKVYNEIKRRTQPKLDEINAKIQEYGYGTAEFPPQSGMIGFQVIATVPDPKKTDDEIMALISKERQQYQQILDQTVFLMDQQANRFFFETVPKQLNVLKKYSGIRGFIDAVIQHIAGMIDSDTPALGPFEGQEYEIQVCVSRKNKNVPVIRARSGAIAELIGYIRPEKKIVSLGGMMQISDTEDVPRHLDIQVGDFYKAKGGVLIVELDKLLTDEWEAAGLKELLDILDNDTIKIKARSRNPFYMLDDDDTKTNDLHIGTTHVFVVADQLYYNLACFYFPTFADKFSLYGCQEHSIDLTDNAIAEYCQIMQNLANKRATPSKQPYNLDNSALKELVELSSFFSNKNGKKLSTDFSMMNNIIKLAIAEAGRVGTISGQHIRSALEKRRKRSFVYGIAKQIREGIIDDRFKIDFRNDDTGAMNALAVYSENTDLMEGIAARVSAYSGIDDKPGWKINMLDSSKYPAEFLPDLVEKAGRDAFTYIKRLCREAGVRYAVDHTIHWPQQYGPIFGDSATGTMTYATLSSLTETLPENKQLCINQKIAATGSMDDRGRVTVIGGVNAKIAGWYQLLKETGNLGPDAGVIIPKDNVIDLHLNQEIRNSVEKGEFSVYAVSHILEGMAILTDSTIDEVKGSVYSALRKHYQDRITDAKRMGPAK